MKGHLFHESRKMPGRDRDGGGLKRSARREQDRGRARHRGMVGGCRGLRPSKRELKAK